MLTVKNGSQQKGEEVKNKELIDHCNSFWDVVGHCEDCKYNLSYCEAFFLKCGDTPYKMNTLLDGEFYTEEEIEV